MRYLIGNTPLLAINFTYNGIKRVIYAKAEHLNLTGSSYFVLKKAYQDQSIMPGMIVDALGNVAANIFAT
jgi:cysteine synthase A